MTPPQLLQVGRLGRAHGVRGDIVVILDTDREERVAPGARLHDGHDWIEIERSRPLSAQRWVVHLVGVDDRTAAERLSGRTLSAEPIDDADALWVHDLVGCEVRDADGLMRGRCVSVVANPASDLLELDQGALVPTTFVVDVVDGVITVDVPDGLFELFGEG